jgi:murein DD-endopeptidase MepM/ murein hydrolase activator NlpD
LVFTGYKLAQPSTDFVDSSVVQAWKDEISHQKQELAATKINTLDHINALSLRMGQLQAHVMRIDALGDRLASMAKLDKGEFDFDQSPAQGGPIGGLEIKTQEMTNLLAGMDELARQLEDREQQLSVLETMMLHRNLQKQVLPTGRPLKGGWTSSYFGIRTDPFTGKRAHHDGVDFAGKLGSDIMAVGAGVVTWSGERYGYGNLVEIDHGNGYVTRYAHSKEILVKIGETVKKGQVVAYMGSSGRSTGPHVHFEVLRNGRVVNPARYISSTQ